MAIKDRLNKVISQLTGDNADALKQELREAILEADTILESSAQANAGEKAKREKLRELESQLATLRDENENLKKNEPELTELRQLKVKWEADKQAGFNKRLTDWQERAKIFGIDKTDKRYDKIEKVKSRFIFPKDDKTALTEAELTANETAYSLLQDTGYFEQADNDIKALPNPANPDPNAGLSSGQAILNQMKK